MLPMHSFTRNAFDVTLQSNFTYSLIVHMWVILHWTVVGRVILIGEGVRI